MEAAKKKLRQELDKKEDNSENRSFYTEDAFESLKVELWPLIQEVQIWNPKWVRLVPNGTNPGVFQIRFQ